jgi:hypothetical protein
MPDDEQNKKILEYATGVRKFEISLFWTRSLFFWGFTTTALAAYGASSGLESNTLQFSVACAGLVCGVAWTLVNRSSKYWHTVWEKKVESRQQAAIDDDLFSVRSNPVIGEKWFWGSKHYSVSKLAIAFSDFTVLIWLGLMFRASPLRACVPESWIIPSIFIFTITYILMMLTRCQPDSSNSA